MADCSM